MSSIAEALRRAGLVEGEGTTGTEAQPAPEQAKPAPAPRPAPRVVRPPVKPAREPARPTEHAAHDAAVDREAYLATVYRCFGPDVAYMERHGGRRQDRGPSAGRGRLARRG
jgi:hypothetical protein